jgi:uncharacterized protein (UPF0210 family)
MKIRSLTCFYNPTAPNAENDLEKFLKLTRMAQQRFADVGFEMQTRRLATTPFGDIFELDNPNQLLRSVQNLESLSQEAGFNFISIGPARIEQPEAYEAIPDLIRATQNVFMTGFMTQNNHVVVPAVQACAKIIAQAADISPDGFGNLRFAALAGVKSGTPFFPAAYHEGHQPAFSIAMECADAAYESFAAAPDILTGRDKMLQTLERAAETLGDIAQDLSREFNIPFLGFDFSLAPFPQDNCTLGGAMEQIGIPRIGQFGSISAAAILADALDKGNWPHIGYNGMMMPVLEDAVLAERSQPGQLSVKDLLLYSAVCGTGLDTVPLPGDITEGQIAAILMDVATMSVRLAKPLTARLMPIPGKKAGEATEFNFEYFANGYVMPLDAQPLNSPLLHPKGYDLNPKHSYGRS